MQKQSLKCVDARHLVHLAVGDDTLPTEEQQLSEHLHQCSDCRAYHAGMVDAMHAIERVRDEDVQPSERSIWPALSGQLKARQAVNLAEPEPRRFNVAVATLCACSLMLALVTAVQNLPSNDVDQFASQPMMPAMNVNFQPQGMQQNPFYGNQMDGNLVPVQQPNGAVVFVDRATGRTYIPNMRPVSQSAGNLDF